MPTLRELRDRIAKGEKVHIPNLGFYCALYDGELRCFNKNSGSKKPMELHLDMDEILSHKWEIYAVTFQSSIDATYNAINAMAKLSKICNAFPACIDCPFKTRKEACGLKEVTKYTPNMWSTDLMNLIGKEAPEIDK